MDSLSNPPLLYASIFLASLVYVAVRSGQQINVHKKLYSMIPVFSMAMGVSRCLYHVYDCQTCIWRALDDCWQYGAWWRYWELSGSVFA